MTQTMAHLWMDFESQYSNDNRRRNVQSFFSQIIANKYLQVPQILGPLYYGKSFQNMFMVWS